MRFEITEHSLLRRGHAREALLALRAMGCSLSLDDFGTGYSSLRWLDRVPFSTLKLDRSLVSTLGLRESEDAQIARAAIDLAHSLRIQVVAEGIERAEQLEALLHLGWDLGQGLLFSDALETEEARALVTRGKRLARSSTPR